MPNMYTQSLSKYAKRYSLQGTTLNVAAEAVQESGLGDCCVEKPSRWVMTLGTDPGQAEGTPRASVLEMPSPHRKHSHDMTRVPQA